jgi:hypothetical protein
VVVSCSVRPETHCLPVVVDAQQLLHCHPVGGFVLAVRVHHIGKDPVPVDEAEVVACGIGPEPERHVLVVDTGDLGLLRTAEVLVCVVTLSIWRGQRVSLVGMGRRADAEIACDRPLVVDPKKLVERRIGLVILGS